MNTRVPFIAYLPSFHLGEPALLLSLDDEAIKWLISKFRQLTATPPATACSSFVAGDGNPLASDGHFLLVVHPDEPAAGTRLFRSAPNEFCWKVSPASAQRYEALLRGLLNSRTPGHQYLDSDDPASPVVIVSRDEYETDWIRGWMQSQEQ
jgi:hypothetical protein